MSERSGFFPYVAGDSNSEYRSDFLARLIASFIGNGVFTDDLAVTAGDNMQIKVPAGKAWINGYFYRNDGDMAFGIANADGVLNRKDTVVLRWNINNRAINLVVLTGTPASTAAAPEITRSAEQYDLKLAEINIPAGTTAIKQSLITDTRLNNSVCGIVHAVIDHIKTETFYAQIQADLAEFKSKNEADFTAWLASIKDTLGEDAAGKLLNLINEHKADASAHVTTLSCTKTGTVYALTGLTATAGIVSCVFKVKDNYHAGDTVTIDGTAYTLRTRDGSALADNAWKMITVIRGIVDINGKRLYVEPSNALTLNGYGTDNGANSVLLSGRKAGTTIGDHSTAEGEDNIASGAFSHAEGQNTTASGGWSHAEGENTIASGYHSHAEGGDTIASNDFAHAEGGGTIASGDYSHAEGTGTIANMDYAHAGGYYNLSMSVGDRFVLGNGITDSIRSNCFRVTENGNVYGLSSYHSSGADYSEFFEWQDENPNKEDRVGHFVTLDGEKIKYANNGDYILGIVSGNPAVIGDHPSESWCERYLRDVFGRLQYEDIEVPETQEKDKDGNIIRTIPAHTRMKFIVNPNYDPAKENEYKNREKRPEWSTVGMMGKLVVIDDGTCEINGYCKPSNGIATKSETGYRVLARLDETHIKVLML